MEKDIIKKEKRKAFLENINYNILFDIIIFISIVLFAITLSPKELQNDTFYTIKCGEYIFNNGISNLKTDEFSWLDLPYCYPHWLYDFMMYVIYLKSGMLGIYISTIVFASLLGIVLYRLALFKSENRVVSAVIMFLGMYLISPYIAARAQLVSFILFGLELLCIEKFLKNGSKLCAVSLVIIGALFAQLHVAVYPMFFIFFLPYIVEYISVYTLKLDIVCDIKKLFYAYQLLLIKDEGLKKEIKVNFDKIQQDKKIRIAKKEKNSKNPYKVIVEKNKRIFALIAIMVIAGFTGLLNPTGFTAYTYLYDTYQGNTTECINEHQPLIFTDSIEFAVAILMYFFLLTFMDLKIKLRDLFMIMGVSYLAFKSKRQIAIFTIASVPIMSELIAQFFEKYDSKTCEKLLKTVASIYGIIVIMVFGYFTKLTITENKDIAYINENDYPVEASKWIKENLDLTNLNIYNEYNYGAYLLYDGIPVFIDSRADLYAPEFNNKEGFAQAGEDIFSEALDVPSLANDYKEVFDKYGVNHVILYSNAKLCLLLNEDVEYNLIYNDNNFKVYERVSE